MTCSPVFDALATCAPRPHVSMAFEVSTLRFLLAFSGFLVLFYDMCNSGIDFGKHFTFVVGRLLELLWAKRSSACDPKSMSNWHRKNSFCLGPSPDNLASQVAGGSPLRLAEPRLNNSSLAFFSSFRLSSPRLPFLRFSWGLLVTRKAKTLPKTSQSDSFEYHFV